MDPKEASMTLARVLLEWRDAGGSIDAVIDAVAGLVQAKIEERERQGWL